MLPSILLKIWFNMIEQNTSRLINTLLKKSLLVHVTYDKHLADIFTKGLNNRINIIWFASWACLISMHQLEGKC